MTAIGILSRSRPPTDYLGRVTEYIRGEHRGHESICEDAMFVSHLPPCYNCTHHHTYLSKIVDSAQSPNMERMKGESP